MKKIIPVLLMAIAVLFSCTREYTNTSEPVEPEAKKRPNIILLIGDGMGLSQLSAPYYFGLAEPSFNRFKIIGLINTSSSSHKITDSGAGATAFSTGHRSFNGAIGVGPDSLPLSNISELLTAGGYRTGIIATCQVTHATPAAFFAHHPDRNAQKEIATQLHCSPVRFVAAGGYGYFVQDNANYLDSLTHKGFVVDTSGVNYQGNSKPDQRYAFLPGQWTLPSMAKGRGNFSENAFNAAMQFFGQDSSPFFLMVEGAQIDWGGHDNDAQYLIEEMTDFEKVVGMAMDFAQKDGNTLVIVCADHETGGFTLGGDDYDSIQPTFSIPGHSASLIPVLAFGPGAEQFSGIFPNTAIFEKILLLTR